MIKLPEKPEVITVAKTLEKKIIGKKITEAKVYYDNVIVGDKEEFISKIKDEKIEKEVKQIEGRIKRTKTKRNKLADGYLDGIIPQERLRNYFLQSLSF